MGWMEKNADKIDRIIICTSLEKDHDIYMDLMTNIYFQTPDKKLAKEIEELKSTYNQKFHPRSWGDRDDDPMEEHIHLNQAVLTMDPTKNHSGDNEKEYSPQGVLPPTQPPPPCTQIMSVASGDNGEMIMHVEAAEILEADYAPENTMRVMLKKNIKIRPQTGQMIECYIEQRLEGDYMFVPHPTLDNIDKCIIEEGIVQLENGVFRTIAYNMHQNNNIKRRENTIMGHLSKINGQKMADVNIIIENYEKEAKDEDINELLKDYEFDEAERVISFKTKRGFDAKFQIAGPEHTKEQVDQIVQFIREFWTEMTVDPSEVTPAKGFSYTIQLEENKIINLKPNRLTPPRRDALQKEVRSLVKGGILEPSTSYYNFNWVLVPKKNGEIRICADLRLLNKITRKIAFSLPKLSDIFENLAGKEDFSVIDMQSGYHSLTLSPECRHLVALMVDGMGKFEYTVMPMGLRGSSPGYNIMMTNILDKLLYQICNVFVDDVLIYGETFEALLENTKTVFKKFRAHNLKVNAKKIQLFRKKVSFLGHVLSKEGVEMDPKKAELIMNTPSPKTAKQTQSWTGLVNFFRKHVEGLYRDAAPLYQASATKPFQWTEACEAGMQLIKNKVSSPPVLAHP
jgi:hypothetical protein